MAHAGATPSWVTLELTERLLMQNSSAYLERLHAIRALGVQIAIDDFGTGYSSLAYLERFPVTHIKIDRSFVTPLDDPSRGDGIVRAIVEIGRALSLTTVAEGIETPTELQRLRELGCVLGRATSSRSLWSGTRWRTSSRARGPSSPARLRRRVDKERFGPGGPLPRGPNRPPWTSRAPGQERRSGRKRRSAAEARCLPSRGSQLVQPTKAPVCSRAPRRDHRRHRRTRRTHS